MSKGARLSPPAQFGAPRLLDTKAVCERLGGISRITLWRMMCAASRPFPRPQKMGRLSVWREDDVSLWIDREFPRQLDGGA